ncbi:MAG: hypothetical protein ACREBP_01015 [Sphingomicrobium sp.]
MIDKIKRHLVDNWRHAWRWWSLRFNALGLLILSFVSFDPVGALGVWNMMPPEVRAYLPHNFVLWVGGIFMFLSMLARVTKQKKPNG